MTPPAEARPTRSDAQRNRARILAVAERAFADEGLDVSMDAIARGAGVGAGTLYRHFPNREALVAGVLETRSPDLEAALAAIRADDADPAVALERWLAAVSDWMRAFEGLPEPLRAALRQDSSPLAMRCDEVIGATDELLQRAQEAGQARPGIRGRDLYLATLAAAWAAGARSADDQLGDGLRELLRSGWSTR